MVIDEAHRLRNVYKGSSKIAVAIKGVVAPFPKVLLTATPLQNSLLELYGLVSVIDDFAFGDLQSYRSWFARLGNDSDFAELKQRLAPFCKRTLRRQVLEYVKYTNRHALVQEFVPTSDEQRLGRGRRRRQPSGAGTAHPRAARGAQGRDGRAARVSRAGEVHHQELEG